MQAIHGKADNGSGATVWACLCDCGQTTYVRGNSMTSGNTKSCGCLARETSSRRMKQARVWERSPRTGDPTGLEQWQYKRKEN